MALSISGKDKLVSFGRSLFKFRFEIIFLIAVYLLGVYLRLLPRIGRDPHLLTFNADIWYRLAICQYLYDHGHLSLWSIRYLPHAFVPEWYPPLFPYFAVFLAKSFNLDLPTVCSRVIPFFESLTPLPFFLLARYLYGRKAAFFSTLALSLTACFVYWNGIASPQSFISFMIPLVILMWVWYVNNLAKIRSRWLFILILGMALAFSFMAHLFYFLMVIILLFVNLSLIMEGRSAFKTYIDLLAAILVSQAATIFWWQPGNLYWWWVKGLVTSSGYTDIGSYSERYGRLALQLGFASSLFIIFYYVNGKKKMGYLLLPIFWAILPFLETVNEPILKFAHRMDLTWSPIFKPLEGFRFHPYLAQPLALCIGISIAAVGGKLRRSFKSNVYVLCAFLLGALLFFDMKVGSAFDNKIQNAGIDLAEYKAAVWFKNNSVPDDLIAADYYKSQMIGGVCGGRSILSLPFPLRNSTVKYINQRESPKTRDDIYTIYSTASAENAYVLMRKYALTHVFISNSLEKIGNFISGLHKGVGAEINRGKFKNSDLFDICYDKDNVMIVKIKKKPTPAP